MNIASRQIGSSLPYDAEVEYLENDNIEKKYIDTLIVVNDGYEVAVDIMPNEISPSTFVADGESGIRLFNYSGRIYIDQYKVTSSTSPGRIIAGSMPVGERGVYRYGNQYVYKNGILIYEKQKVDLTTSTSVRFLLGKERTYSFKLSQDRNVVFNSIPVRFTNENGVSEGAMYDRVSGQIFRNQGTGAFVIGPDKKGQATE